MVESSNMGPAITAAVRWPKERLGSNSKAQLREVCRFRRMSERTEEAYWGWVRRFIVWAKDHPHLTPGETKEPLTPSPHPKPRSHPMGEGGGGLSAPLERGEQAKHWRHSRELGAREVQAFLTYLAAATQNQALNALVFFYKLRL